MTVATHHAVWPEGLPDQVVHTTSWWRAHWRKLKLQLHYMVHIRTARRVRHAISAEGVPDPQAIEHRLREAGAIPPPGGWRADNTESSAPGADIGIRVVTRSVI